MDKKQYNNLSDEDLLHKIATKRDEVAFEVLYHRYAHLSAGLCMSYLKDKESATDAVQDIFFKIWTDVGSYNVRYFKAWLYQVSKNHCLSVIRKNNNAPIFKSENDIGFMEIDESWHHKYNEEKLLTLLSECMEKLSEEQKKCIELFYIEKKSYHDASQITGYQMKQVKSYIQNGKRNLKICVSSQWDNL